MIILQYEKKQFNSTFPILSKPSARIKQNTRPNSKHIRFTAKPSDYLPSSPYSQCDHIFDKNMFDKRRNLQDTFICQTHSSSWSGSNRPIIKTKAYYRMAIQPQPTHFISKTIPSCHRDQ